MFSGEKNQSKSKDFMSSCYDLLRVKVTSKLLALGVCGAFGGSTPYIRA